MGPLHGINVLDFGTAGVGPWAASLLGQLGANVIKLEPPFGDAIQAQPPHIQGVSTAYIFCNQRKRCAVLDLKDNRNRPIVERLLRQADIVMHNLRPAAIPRLGLEYESVSTLNPTVVYVECSPWGTDGPMKDQMGIAGVAAAFSGFWSLSGEPNGRAEWMRYYAYTDFNASNYIVAATLVGLYSRQRTGQPQYIQLSQFSASIATEIDRIAEYLATGDVPKPLGHAAAMNAPHQAFLCQDGQYLAVGVETEKQWRGLCKALGATELGDDPRFTSNVKRVTRREELAEILQAKFVTKPGRWWVVRLSAERVPCGYFYDFERLRNHAQVIENEFMPIIEQPKLGPLYTGGLPWKFSKTPASLGTAPLPGEHTQEISKHGFGSDGAKPRNGGQLQIDAEPPLNGLKVIDATQGVCGPYISLLLALSGAEVTKVEPPEGDNARGYFPPGPTGDSALFRSLNRNKSGITLDIETSEGKAVLKEAAQNADVFIEDWGVESAEALGLSYEDLARTNSGLIYCALTPFGESGPFRDLPASELVIQAVTDAVVYRSSGKGDAPPVRVGADIVGLSTGITAFQAIVAAIFHKYRTGEGQRVALSHMGTMMNMWGALWMAMTNPDEWLDFYCNYDVSSRTYGLQTRDREVYTAVPTLKRPGVEEDFVNLLEELGVKEVVDNPALSGQQRDAQAVKEFYYRVRGQRDLWQEYFANMTAEEIFAKTSRMSTISVPLNTIEEVLAHPQTAVLQMIDHMQLETGDVLDVIGLPWKGPWQKVSSRPMSFREPTE